MNIISKLQTNLSSFIYQTIPAQYENTNRYTRLCGIICGMASAEMAIRAVGNAWNLYVNGPTEALKYCFSANLGGAVFYGISALNPIPGVTSIAGTIFSFYSYLHFKFQEKEIYFISEVVGRAVNVIVETMSKVFEIVEPILRTIADYSYKIIEMIPLHKHPVWAGVGILLTAIFIMKIVVPYIRSCLAQPQPQPT